MVHCVISVCMAKDGVFLFGHAKPGHQAKSAVPISYEAESVQLYRHHILIIMQPWVIYYLDLKMKISMQTLSSTEKLSF